MQRLRKNCKLHFNLGQVGDFMAAGNKSRMIGEQCNICGHELNTWDARLSKSLAYKNKVCEKCIANEYDMDVDVLRERMEDYFGIRPCQGI